jgi:polyferredoxin
VIAVLPWVGLGLYIANLALGVGVQFKLVSTKRWHWVHHALYAVVFAGALAATLGSVVLGARWWPMVLTLGALAVLPRYKGGSRPHMTLATLGFVGYVLALA